MTHATVKDLVHERAHATGFYSMTDLRTVSVRLEDYRVVQLDLLTSMLGFSSRQQLVSALLGSAIDDGLHELSETLQDDTAAHADFIREQSRILDEALGGP